MHRGTDTGVPDDEVGNILDVDLEDARAGDAGADDRPTAEKPSDVVDLVAQLEKGAATERALRRDRRPVVAAGAPVGQPLAHFDIEVHQVAGVPGREETGELEERRAVAKLVGDGEHQAGSVEVLDQFGRAVDVGGDRLLHEHMAAELAERHGTRGVPDCGIRDHGDLRGPVAQVMDGIHHRMRGIVLQTGSFAPHRDDRGVATQPAERARVAERGAPGADDGDPPDRRARVAHLGAGDVRMSRNLPGCFGHSRGIAMQSELSPRELAAYVARQLEALFDDGSDVENLEPFARAAMTRLERCIAATDPEYAYFWRDGRPFFNHRHSDLYAMYLYLLANAAHHEGASVATCEKLFLLNKALHALDVFYTVALPEVFVFAHPVGTVLGRATYGDHLLVYQRVTVGSSHDVGDYPTIGRFVSLYAGATVLGACAIGDRTSIAAGSLVLNRDVPARSRYVGAPPSEHIAPSGRIDPIWRDEA